MKALLLVVLCFSLALALSALAGAQSPDPCVSLGGGVSATPGATGPAGATARPDPFYTGPPIPTDRPVPGATGTFSPLPLPRATGTPPPFVTPTVTASPCPTVGGGGRAGGSTSRAGWVIAGVLVVLGGAAGALVYFQFVRK